MSFEDVADCVVQGAVERISDVVKAHLAAGASAQEIIDQGLLAGMAVVGQRFKAGDMFIPEVMRSAKAMNDAMLLLEPLIVGGQKQSVGKVVMGTVEGDLHNIGKDLVGMLLKSSGYEVVDLGVNVPAARFVEAASEEKPDVVGLSALLTTTMPAMKQAVAALTAHRCHGDFKIIVGGAPVTGEFAQDIGADGYAPDAGAALEKVNELVGRA